MRRGGKGGKKPRRRSRGGRTGEVEEERDEEGKEEEGKGRRQEGVWGRAYERREQPHKDIGFVIYVIEMQSKISN